MPMLRHELDVELALNEVWSYVSDFANSAEWDPGVTYARKMTAGPLRVGTRYDLHVLFNGKELPMTYEIVAFEPPHRVELRGEGARIRAIDDIRFEPTPEGTKILYTADLRLTGAWRAAEPLLRSRFAELGERAIEGMRTTLRSRAGLDPHDQAGTSTSGGG